MLPAGVTVYFVRHGQTDWNAAHRAQGHSDIPLNAEGRAQARRNGRRLAEVLSQKCVDPGSLDYVVSPLDRARETMGIVRGELGLDAAGARVDERLKEIGFGVDEGMSWPDYAARLLDRHARGLDPWDYASAGGESYAAVTARMLPVFREAARDSVIVAHGGISRCLVVALGAAEKAETLKSLVPQDKLKIMVGETLTWV